MSNQSVSSYRPDHGVYNGYPMQQTYEKKKKLTCTGRHRNFVREMLAQFVFRRVKNVDTNFVINDQSFIIARASPRS